MKSRILLIDRDHVRRVEYARAFSRAGFNVAHYDSGKDGLCYLLSNPVSGVVLEYNSAYEPFSPVPAGQRIVHEITECDPFLPLVLVCDRGDMLENQTVAAADLVLRHPVVASAVVAAMEELTSESLRERAQRKTNCIFVFR